MSRSSSGIVAGLTAAAIAVVGFLAYQASADVPDTLGKHAPSPSATPGAQAHKGKAKPVALPAGSGQGMRIVYALHDQRVWLVAEQGKATRTFTVTPSAISPRPGTYTVSSRSVKVTGSDGVPVEHVVRFAVVDGVTIGFSAAVDGSTASPDPNLKTGGVRMKRADGNALWSFATIGSRVVVVK